jgi:hypothetical protein
VVLAGLGSEIVLGRVIIESLQSNPNGFVAWHFAQLVFSLLLTVAFTANDGIGLFFLPMHPRSGSNPHTIGVLLNHALWSSPRVGRGLWKMGFPETISALVMFQQVADYHRTSPPLDPPPRSYAPIPDHSLAGRAEVRRARPL